MFIEAEGKAGRKICQMENDEIRNIYADGEQAERLYEYIIEKCRSEIVKVERGEFGADMKVELLNDGPFTVILDSEELKTRN